MDSAMTLNNTNAKYGAVTKTFHWLTVLLIVTVIPLGVIAHGAPFETNEDLSRKALLFSLHKTVGVTIFVVALARILWAFSQPKPGLLNAGKPLESLAAETVHWLLYGSLVIVPLTGWITHAATTGFAPIFWPFGQSLPFVPKNEAVAHTASTLHMIFERVMVLSLLLHIAGALKHHFIDKDATLRRMLPGQVDVTPVDAKHRVVLPLAMAFVAWGAALSVGAGIGLFHAKEGAVQAAQLEQVQSEWTVTQGTLGIAVQQFGSQVTGEFADWTADITFTDVPAPAKSGDVTVQIAIGSLTLGSVTDQAMGPDFFDADAFPTATFQAELYRAADGFEARGTLGIKDKTVPVTMPFTLKIEGDTAEMTAGTTLDRRSFGIGDTMADESNLGFAVEVDITLTATRAPE